MKTSTLIIMNLFFLLLVACSSQREQSRVPEPVVIETMPSTEGPRLEVHFARGKSFNHPLMAIWVEDMEGNYLQTLYVAQSIAKGVFLHGDASTGRWMPGEIRRPAALPYWGHQRGIQAEDGLYLPSAKSPLPDAVTGATPKGDFVLRTRLNMDIPRSFRLLFEINQTWDWNEYWTNLKFPDDPEYKTSSQPALVYAVAIDRDEGINQWTLQPIGHSHYSGKDGSLTSDLSTLTTALQIAREIVVRKAGE
jgi:hypothetical protein